MQVTNTANLAAQSVLKPVNNSAVPAQEQRQSVLAREKLNNDESQSQKSQADNNSRQRLDFDEQAISLIERDQLAQFESRTTGQSDQPNNFNSRYDSPSNLNKLAVAAYQSVGDIAQRDNIQQIFGVDLYA